MVAEANILGVRIAEFAPDGLFERVIAEAKSGTPTVIGYANVHVLNSAHRHPPLQRFLRQADVVYCDGSGVALAARWLGTPIGRRLTAADFVEPLMQRLARERLSVFILAGTRESVTAAADRLLERVPGLELAGVAHGYRAEDADEELVDAINESGARVLFVGMGSPRQEEWVLRNRDRLQVGVIWVVGALFDFVSGHIRRGPRWMTDHHLEWLARLLVEPRKLARRYLLGNPLFLGRVLWQRWRRR